MQEIARFDIHSRKKYRPFSFGANFAYLELLTSQSFWKWSVPMFAVLGYFDPGSGSLLVQAIAGGAAGLLVFAKYLWDSVPAFFGHKRDDSPDLEGIPTKSPQMRS